LLLFLIAGLPALFSALVLPFSPPTALPWVLISWPIVAVSGYRIWRIDHPSESARDRVGWGVQVFLTAMAFGGIALAFSLAWPLVVGAFILIGGVLFYGLTLRVPPPEAPPSVPREDPPADT
jgi:hypothetical protein